MSDEYTRSLSNYSLAFLLRVRLIDFPDSRVNRYSTY